MWQPEHSADGLHDDTDNDGGTTPALPPISAAFLVKFDMRKGYTIAWTRSVPELELEGVVEYKSLPSGLHNIKEDLVYFVHEGYAGISAFVNEPDSKEERNVSMVSFGVLVALEHGRMGKSWLHADKLKEVAHQQIADMNNPQRLEEYWKKHKVQDGGTSENEEAVTDAPEDYRPSTSNTHSNGPGRRRGTSDATAGHRVLSAFHPALSLEDLVKSLGPLLFPLYRAALLRKRILLIGEAPVHRTCDFIYDLSVLSTVPKALASLLPIDGTPALRLRPLFNVGVQDIPELSRSGNDTDSNVQSGQAWLACTTDDVLATKPELFDMLVMLPSSHAQDATTQVFPKLVESSPSLSKSFPKIGLKATQRDARRYQALRAGMRSMRPSKPAETAAALSNPQEEDDAKSVTSSTISRKSLVEPTSWSLVAYTSILWWASAGEKRSDPMEQEAAEQEQDRDLLATDIEDTMDDSQRNEPPMEVALVSYFHRLTSLIFTTICDAISRHDGEDVRRNSNTGRYKDNPTDDEIAGEPVAEDIERAIDDSENDGRPLLKSAGEDDPVEITQDDVTAMGLDIWSAADRTFIEQLVKLWWGRTAEVNGGRVECCGVRLL